MITQPTESEARAIFCALNRHLMVEANDCWGGNPLRPVLSKFCAHNKHQVATLRQIKWRPIDDWLAQNDNFSPRRKEILSDGAHKYIRQMLDVFSLEMQYNDTDYQQYHYDVISLFQSALLEISNKIRCLGFFYSHANNEACDQSQKASYSLLKTVAAQSERNLYPEIHGQEAVDEHNRRWEKYHDAIDQLTCEKNFAAIRLLSDLADTGKAKLRTQSGAGRPKSFWREDFVAYLAHIWWNLFGKLPGMQPESAFSAMVEATWHTALDCYPPPKFPSDNLSLFEIPDDRIEELYGLNWDHNIRSVLGFVDKG